MRGRRFYLLFGFISVFVSFNFSFCVRQAKKGEVAKCKPTSEIRLEPVKIVAKRGDKDKLELIDYDAKRLFIEGNQHLLKRGYKEAIAYYDTIIKEFPDSIYKPYALYNKAYSFLYLDKIGEAKEVLKEVIRQFPSHFLAKEAYLSLAYLYEKEEDWKGVELVYREQLKFKDRFTPLERMEILVGLGVALVKQGKYREGELFLKRAIVHFRSHSIDEIPTDFYIGKAYFHIGEIYRSFLQKVTFSIEDEKKLREEFTKKTDYLIKAQIFYIQAIRTRNPYWATASGFRAGELYYIFYKDVIGAPIPPTPEPPEDFTQEEREIFIEEFPRVYKGEVKKRIKPFLERAIDIWEKTVLMSERIGVDNEWTELIRAHLESAKNELIQNIEEEEKIEDRLPSPSIEHNEKN